LSERGGGARWASPVWSLFPDQSALNREENRRWELTEVHYDLPIRIIDPNGDGEE
jgi:hypothetical protein